MNLDELKRKLPYISNDFAALYAKLPFISLFSYSVNYEFSDKVLTAAVDGATFYINKDFFDRISPYERLFVIAHELMHLALHHASRRGDRDPIKWNIAADIVVNAILKEYGFRIPDWAVTGERFKIFNAVHYTVEEVYDMIKDMEAAIEVDIIGEKDMPGTIPDDKYREYQKANGKLDWKSLLLTNIISGFSKKMMQSYFKLNRKLDDYPGIVKLSHKRLFVVIDTSGSITVELLTKFMAELESILKVADDVTIIYFDAKIQKITKKLEPPVGGGGTEIKEVVDYLNKHMQYGDGVIIFSDGEIYDLDKVDFSKIKKRASVFITVGPKEFIKGVKHLKI